MHRLRRLITAPAVVLLALVVEATLPLWVLAAAALSPVLPGHWRPLRVLWVAFLYLLCDSVVLLILLGWVALVRNHLGLEVEFLESLNDGVLPVSQER